MSRLEQLPQGFRREILRYLLLSLRVRQPPDYFLVEKSFFETSILCVSRSMYQDAAAVLYGENHFVKIHRSPYISPALSLSDQAALSKPFEQLTGMAWVQSAVFANTFDPQLASTDRESMTQKVAWLRGLSAEIYDIALSIKRTGDRSFAMSNGDIAMANYLDVHNFLEAAIKRKDIMVSSLEFDFILRLYSLDVISCVDRALVILLDMGKQYFGQYRYDLIVSYNDVVQVAYQNMSKMGKHSPQPSIFARFHYLLGLAELGLNHPIKAGKAFANAYKILPSQEIKDGHQSAKAWKNLDTKKRIARRKVLFADLPKSPISVPDQEDLASPSVASEHWVMRELGFKGHIPYSDKIKSNHMIALTNKPHPNKVTPGPRTARIGKVLPEALTKHVERYEKGKDWPGAEGKLVCWVGFTAGEIGEESIWDDAEVAANLQNMGMGV